MVRRIKPILSVGAAVSVATAASVLMAQGSVGPKDIAFPKGFESWQRYQIVDRHDVKQYRELYAKPEVVQACER
jgi:hypothetical protein